jgi:hypothetical protein
MIPNMTINASKMIVNQNVNNLRHSPTYRSTVSKTGNKLMPSANKNRNLSATLTGNNARNYFDNHKGNVEIFDV